MFSVSVVSIHITIGRSRISISESVIIWTPTVRIYTVHWAKSTTIATGLKVLEEEAGQHPCVRKQRINVKSGEYLA
ncbi:hypothetical protein EG68_05561 [Paragonimus skrjabini miyazakii]|uniref:Uncharacterized protein n=1 Tax=Paragonimus skrjabini miyazakii TaxID=59628 RepID=A0A8S9YWI7_9TREM|nr:hypothetical protein EG68_05561 [Paragonimus skrjabini miyazakii]